MAWRGLNSLDKAINDFNEAIRLKPNFPTAFNNRGNCWLDKSDFTKANKDYSEAITLNPKNNVALYNRSLTWLYTKQYDKAIQDCDEALRINGKYAPALGGRARALAKNKEYEKALKDFEAAALLNPPEWLFREFALFRASCPDPKMRDGKQALELAQKAVAMQPKSAKSPKNLAALAAAYAEIGDFEAAVRHQLESLNAGTINAQDRADFQARLQLYQQKKPYRDE